MSQQTSHIETSANDRDPSRVGVDFNADMEGLSSEAIGSIDELSCWIGVLIASVSATHVKQLLSLAQHDLVDLMVQIKLSGSPMLSSKHLVRIENGIESLRAQVEPPTALTLPGGLPVAAFTHLTRSVCRRAERRLYGLVELDTSADAMLGKRSNGVAGDYSGLVYLKSLAELLLLISRLENHDGRADVTWDRAKSADLESGD